MVGNFDPPIGVSLPAPENLNSVLGSLPMGTLSVNGDEWYSFTPIRSGTISIDANQTSAGAALSAYLYDADFNLMGSSSATAVGHIKLSHSVVADATYIVRLSGHGASADVNLTNQVPDDDRLDVSRDHLISALDALKVINELNAFGPHAAPTLASDAKFYYDTSLDGRISPIDALQVINYLIARSTAPGAGPAAAPQVAAGGPSTAPLVAGPQAAAESVDLSAAVAFGVSLGGGISASPAVTAPIAPLPADAVYAQLAAAPAAAASPTAAAAASQAQIAAPTASDAPATADALLTDPEWDWLS